MFRKLIYAFVYGNWFYGICAVALSIEATLQQKLPFNSFLYYVSIFSMTVLYYTRAYITEKKSPDMNPRSLWYYNNRHAIIASQIILTIVVLTYLIWLFSMHNQFVLHMSSVNWILLGLSPSAAALYYGVNHRMFARYNLRSIGWLKPFIIGFVWAGLVNIYPLIFYNIEHELNYLPDLTGIFLFIKNFMYISVLSIMFDIKDYAADHNRDLKTFVVKSGLRKTIFYILIPLCIAGLASFICYAWLRQFSLPKILVNTIPFVLLIAVAYSMHRRKPIFYYLTVIDGLMLVKAICGTMAMIFF